MKKLVLVFILLSSLVLAQEIKTFVNDYSNLLTANEKSEIEVILKEIYDSGKAEYAIVIIDSLEDQDIEGYAYNLAEGKLGDKDKNNGMLLLIAVEDRQYRFEVGRALEPIIPDIIAGRIGRNYIQPNFKQENYAKGIKEASLAVRDVLFGNEDSDFYVTKESNPFMFIPIIIIILIIIIAIIASSKSRYKHQRKRSDADFFTAAWFASRMMRGGGSGGFGGFGGGSFGGGGMSGKW